MMQMKITITIPIQENKYIFGSVEPDPERVKSIIRHRLGLTLSDTVKVE